MPLPLTIARLNRDLTNRVAIHVAGWLPPFAILEHRGRTSGRLYRTPLMLFRDGDSVLVVLTYGERTDWLRNLQAAGGGVAIQGNAPIQLSNPVVESGADAIALLPRTVRLILRLLGVNQVVRLTVGTSFEPEQNSPDGSLSTTVEGTQSSADPYNG